MTDNRMKQKERPPSAEGNGLQKSLKLIFVYTVATGSIFTYVSYWDSVFQLLRGGNVPRLRADDGCDSSDGTRLQ